MPPTRTLRVSSTGRTMILAPKARSSRLSLSPMSVATATMAVATATPKATAIPASSLERRWRWND